MTLPIGSKIPDFKLQAHTGITVSNKTLMDPCIFYFYPKDDTSGCTTQACAFKQGYNELKLLGVKEIYGVSSDGLDSHKTFAEKYNLEFPLLSDIGGVVRKLFGAYIMFGMVPSRVTYLIKDGKVEAVYKSETKFSEHMDEMKKHLSK